MSHHMQTGIRWAKMGAVMALMLTGFWNCARYTPEYVPLTLDEARIFSDSIASAIEAYDARFFFEHEDKARTIERLDVWMTDSTVIREEEEARSYLAQLAFATFALEGDPELKTGWVYARPNGLELTPDSNYVIQVRVHDPEFEVNYYKFLVERRNADPRDRYILTDMYSYNLGMWVSELVYHQYQASQYFEAITAPMDSLTLLDSLYLYVQQNDFVSADSMFHVIPPEGRELLIPNKIYLDIAGNVSEQHYEAALDMFEERFPQDPDLLRRRIQWTYFSKNFDAFHVYVDTLEERLGGADSYTLWAHGDAYQLAGKADTARNFFQEAADKEPQFLLPFLSLFYNALERQDYSGAIAQLDDLDKRFGVKLGMLEVDAYPAFLNSKELEEWTLQLDPMP